LRSHIYHVELHLYLPLLSSFGRFAFVAHDGCCRYPQGSCKIFGRFTATHTAYFFSLFLVQDVPQI
jgi:hypothetical protein